MDNFVIEKVVTEDMLAVNVGSGSLRVLATPTVVALMEEASTKLADTFLDEGLTTVGTMVEIQHISPSPIGAKIKVESKLISNDGRSFKFEVTAYDNAGTIYTGREVFFSGRKEICGK